MDVDLTLYAAEAVKTGSRVGQIWPPRLPVHGRPRCGVKSKG